MYSYIYIASQWLCMALSHQKCENLCDSSGSDTFAHVFLEIVRARVIKSINILYACMHWSIYSILIFNCFLNGFHYNIH